MFQRQDIAMFRCHDVIKAQYHKGTMSWHDVKMSRLDVKINVTHTIRVPLQTSRGTWDSYSEENIHIQKLTTTVI